MIVTTTFQPECDEHNARILVTNDCNDYDEIWCLDSELTLMQRRQQVALRYIETFRDLAPGKYSSFEIVHEVESVALPPKNSRLDR